MRLIDATALLEAYDAHHKGTPGKARELIENAPTVGGWISVKDRLPMFGCEVLVVNDDGKCGVAVRTEESLHPMCWQIKYCLYDNDCWDEDENGVITHWMPLPEAPKEES